MIVIDCEFIPPSVNSLFRNVPGKGRVRTAEYKRWARDAGWSFNGCGAILGDFTAIITIDRAKVRKGSDLDNRAKGILDLLVTHKIVEDDSKLVSLTIRYGDAPKGLRVEVQHA